MSTCLPRLRMAFVNLNKLQLQRKTPLSKNLYQMSSEMSCGMALPAEQSAGNSSSSLSVSEMSIIEEEAVLELVWITPNKHFVGMSSINEDI
jgi:hypothetical protein